MKAKEFKGTKGEWKVVIFKTDYGTESREIQFGNDGECVAEHVADENDAKLIASAPDLLESLMAVTNELYQAIECINGKPSADKSETIAMSNKAINKALN